MVGHEVDDEVVRGRDNDDGGKGTGEIVRVICNGFVLDSLEAGAELVERVSLPEAVFGLVVTSDCVHAFEFGEIQRVGVAVVGVGVVSGNRAVAFVVVVRIGETLSVADETTNNWKPDLREWPADGPDAFNDIAVYCNCISG